MLFNYFNNAKDKLNTNNIECSVVFYITLVN